MSTAIRRTRPRSREESRAETRAAVLEAAEAAFLERGYDGAAIEEIAQRAGFTKGAVYSNFGSKEDLFLAASAARDDRLGGRLLRGLADAKDIEGCLAAVDAWYRSTIVDSGGWALATTEFTLVALRKPDLHKLLKEQHLEARDAIAWLLTTQMDTFGHSLPTEATVLAEVLIALVNGLAITHAVDDSVSHDLFLPAFRTLLGL